MIKYFISIFTLIKPRVYADKINKKPIPKSKKLKVKYNSLQLRDKYIDSKTRLGKITKKTVDDYYKNITLVLDLYDNQDLNEMDRENAELIRDALSEYPKNKSKLKEFNKTIGFDVIDKNKELKKDTLSPRRVKKIIHDFSGFCEWCFSHEYINKNYFYKLPTLPPRKNDIRHEFNDQQLTLIFNMEQYIKNRFKHPYYYWVPLLLRFTGARLNEICQLHIKDIIELNGVHCIYIRDEQVGQTLKSRSSYRKIPIHNTLINKGFIEFTKNCNSTMLFPELKLVNGYYSHNASKWFSRRREKLGLSKGFDAHSFRHSFVNELKQKGIKTELIQSIVGHSSNCITLDVYGKSYEPQILLKAISKISDEHVRHIQPYNKSQNI
ncbi:site-specific integrase [Shewanella sp. ENK2]|uniref:site-specific integrase n=1 Tax=Shewanella sp. ENK2 TaxID=2775245 RepID=UPI00374788D8